MSVANRHASASRVVTFAATVATIATIATVLAAGCASDWDPGTFFPATYASDYAKIADCAKSNGHGGVYVETWVDKGAHQAWEDQTTPYAEGTVFMKVGFDDAACKNLANYWAMKKGPDSTNGPAGDWIWQSVDADGQVGDEGQMAGCTGCHAAYASTDYVGTQP